MQGLEERRQREMRDERSTRIFVISDGTGQTAADAVRAAMSQFPHPWRMRTIPSVRTAAAARRGADEAARAGATVVYTLVNEVVERALRDRCDELQVRVLDLLGPLIRMLGEVLHARPHQRPGLLHGMSEDYFGRIEAVEFAVRHDDGANPGTLYQADIVLTGVSRSSKTPLSMYLAQRGYKTGNIPLIRGLPTPPELLDLNPNRVFGLVLEPARLLEIRRARARFLGRVPYRDYADPEVIHNELQEARRLFRSRGWRIVDISGRAVEENASRIIELYQLSWIGKEGW